MLLVHSTINQEQLFYISLQNTPAILALNTKIWIVKILPLFVININVELFSKICHIKLLNKLFCIIHRVICRIVIKYIVGFYN